MVGVNISHSYFHPGGAHITWVKIISHTGLYLADPTSPIPSHCASIVVTSTLRVKALFGAYVLN